MSTPTQPAVRRRDVFRFRELPMEIQLNIFRLLIPITKPQSATQTAAMRFNKWIWSRNNLVPFHSQLYQRHRHMGSAEKLIMLDTGTYRDFAPHLYQKAAFRFTDPLSLEHCFVGATNVYLHNLRHLSCAASLDQYPNPSSDPDQTMLRLENSIINHPELGNLLRFEFIYLPSKLFVQRADDPRLWRYDAIVKNRNDLWLEMDIAYSHAFSSFRNRLKNTTFLNFRVATGLKLSRSYGVISWPHNTKVSQVINGVQHLNIAFIARGRRTT